MVEAENASHIAEEAEQLDQSSSNLFLEKNGSGLTCNNISLHTAPGEVDHLSSIVESADDIDKKSNYGHINKEPLCEADCQGILFQSSEQKNSFSNTDMQSDVINTSALASDFSHAEQQQECFNPKENLAKDCSIELIELKQSDGDMLATAENIAGECTTASKYDIKDQLGSSVQNVTSQPILEQLEPLPDDTSKKSRSCLHQLVLALSFSAKGHANSNEASCRKSRAKVKSATKVEREYKLRSSTGRSQSPKSSIQDKAAASEPDSAVDDASDSRKRARRKKHRNRKSHDEFSRMRSHLRYLLHRMRYEQNLIDAYSSEGWRGQSLEKLRPEKEIQRAKSDINRSKLKIRSLFQRIDAICAEGQFPESLFDSDGLIDSEDIFCAKCGSKDLPRDNDIILCDGACDRGFHQLCLDPPLRTEEIPPGDQGWLCPACDCKSDCIELLNDSVGTQISMSDNWENVFPEAAKVGNALDDASGLPSDDSEDDDFNPSGADDEDMNGDESTSDESDFSSASEDLGAIQNNDEQYLGLPSDDSEDDDYNPDFVDAEEQPKQESSSSDFTSASEDLNAVSDNNNEVSSRDGCEMSPSKLVQDFDDSMPVSVRRQAERLDYKKLYDETYGNASTDSSDDEEWKDAATPKKRKNGRENAGSQLSEGEEWKDAVTPKRRRCNPRNASGGISKVVVVTSTTRKAPLSPMAGVSQTLETTSGGKRQPYKRLGDEVTQRLHASFKENQYPVRSVKENLAAELGLTPKQVDKWFVNARWSFNHPITAPGSSTSGVVSKGVDKLPNVGETSAGKIASRSGKKKKKK